MRFPYLDSWDNATCEIHITDTKPSENGDFTVLKIYEGGCNLSEKSRTVRNANGEYVRLSSVLHIKGDIAPELSAFSGKARIVNNQTMLETQMLIETVDRPRNPDGTVHHTRLGLI